MFRNSRNTKRLVAFLIVFTMLFANMFTVVQYAADSIGKQVSTETNENVVYDVKFVLGEEEKGYEYSAKMDEENLAIKLNINVKNNGYLKNESIQFEADNGLNFEMGEIKDSEFTQGLTGNKLKLNQINGGDSAEVVIPIKYKATGNIDNLSKVTKVKFSGIYVDNEGNSNKISEDINLKLTWNINSELMVSSELSKYIPFSSNDDSGVIVQTIVKMSMGENASLVGKESLTIDALSLDDMDLESVTVIRNNESDFSEDNWKFDKENNVIKIDVDNSGSDEFIDEEFLITYKFKGDDNLELPISLNSKINASVEMFGSNEKLEAEKDELYTVSEKVGDIVSINSEILEDDISKGNILANKYNEDKLYSTSYEINHRVNISSKDLVSKVSITDVDEYFASGDVTSSTVNSSKYTMVRVPKDQFDSILGTDGRVVINSNGDEVASITSSSEVDSDGNYFTKVSDLSRITILLSAPVSEGNLNIKAQKEIRDTEYSVDDIKAWSSIEYKAQGDVYLADDVKNMVSDGVSSVSLTNTKTEANLSINKNTLSTIAVNENVELKVCLNNDKVGSDFYQNPKFKITLPEYIEQIDLKNVAIANAGDELKIKNANAVAENGRIVIYVDLEGTEKTYSLNNATNGSNIIINTDMTTNKLTPSKDDIILMEYSNEIASEYSNDAKDEKVVTYVAPSGVISSTEISNYNGEGSKVGSVEQGTKIDKIEIFDEAKVSNMNILVMNNEKNLVKDMKIIGRVPFKGNKDVATGEDLGTTVDTKMVSSIVANLENKVGTKVYYSENADATLDLDNSSNGWMESCDDFSKVRSYMIVFDGDVENGEIVSFSYSFEIPENLEHNNNIFGTFETVYTNVSEVAETKKVSTPDVVGLTTGKGPNLAVSTRLSSGDDSIKEHEKVKYIIDVTNKGEEEATDVVVKTELPNGITLTEYQKEGSIFDTKGWKYIEGSENKVSFDSIKPGETKTVDFTVEAKMVDESENKLNWVTSVDAKDLAKTLNSETIESYIEKAEVVVEESTETIADIIQEDDELTYKIAVKNTSDSVIENVKIEKDLPSLLKYSNNYVQDFDDELNLVKNTNNCNYDSNSRKVTWVIDSINPGTTKYVVLDAVAGKLGENVYEDKISTNSKVIVNSNTYFTGEVDETLAKPKLVAWQVTNNEGEYINEGNELNYTLKIRNDGIVQANQVTVTDSLPENVSIKSLAYTVDGTKAERTVSGNDDAVIYTSLAPDSELSVDITAVADKISSSQRSISNMAMIEADNADDMVTNKVNNIIEKVYEAETYNNDDGDIVETADFDSDVKVEDGRYKITGIAWIDQNENGSKDKEDSIMEGLTAELVDAESGNVLQVVATNQNGEYSFSNLKNGNYYVVFDYNFDRYAVTDYMKENVANNVNSNVISAKIQKDGVENNAAVSDIIKIDNGSVSNVNAGFIATGIFDLSIKETISSITVQDDEKTRKVDYDNQTLAKIEIDPTKVASSKVFVEYSIVVKNEGDVEGFAKKIVDYIPEGMEFSTELNPSWYQGSDGYLYNEELADVGLGKNEERTIKLILTKTMTEDNTGIVNNVVEIAESYNKFGISDRDSTPGNRAQGEDDYASADALLSLNTGSSVMYIAIIAIIAFIAAILFIFIKKNRYKIKWALNNKKEVI